VAPRTVGTHRAATGETWAMFYLQVSLFVFSFQFVRLLCLDCQWGLLVHVLPIWAACDETRQADAISKSFIKLFSAAFLVRRESVYHKSSSLQ